GQTEGFVKVVADAGSGQLLGAHIIGPRATDLIAEAALAVQNGLTLEQIDLTIHAHPTLPESLMEAALAAQGRAIHIANRKSSLPTPAASGGTSPQGGEVNTNPAGSGGTSPQGGEVSTSTANMQNRGEK